MNKVTVPAGRFLLDLPRDARVHFGRQGFNAAGDFIQSHPAVSPDEAEDRVARAARALTAPHEEGGTQLEWLAAGPRPHSWLLYYWKDTLFKEDELEVNGYFWLDGVVFVFRNRCGAHPGAMEDQARRWEEVMGRLKRRNLREIPPVPSFCIRDGCFRSGVGQYSREHIELLADFGSRRDLRVRLCTHALGEWTHVGASRGATGGERGIGPLQGQERIRTGVRETGAPFTTFLWESSGCPRDPLRPRIQLELRTGSGRGVSERDSALWEEIRDSLRLQFGAGPLLNLPPGASLNVFSDN